MYNVLKNPRWFAYGCHIRSQQPMGINIPTYLGIYYYFHSSDTTQQNTSIPNPVSAMFCTTKVKSDMELYNKRNKFFVFYIIHRLSKN